MTALAPYLKAVTAALVAGVAVLANAEGISTQDGAAALLAFLVALGAVWAVPNRPKVG